MRLKVIENFDSGFTLDPQAQKILFDLLIGEKFCQQVAEQAQCHAVIFAELLFQPIPYTTNTPRGMPAEFERYHESPDYLIINVPPNFMFAAKIFKPSRLCAIYQIILA